jgi:hypothetical protein
MTISEPKRLFHDAPAGAPAQLPGPNPEQRNAGAFRFNNRLHRVSCAA